MESPLLPLLPEPEPGPPDGTRPGWALAVLLALTVLFVAGLGIAAVLVSRGDGDRGTGRSTPTPGARALRVGAVVAVRAARPSGTTGEPVATIAGRTGGVRVSGLGSERRVTGDDGAFVAESGARLRTFTLADGPCQEEPCQPWTALRLEVVVDGQPVPLPAGGPSYAVAVREGASAELRFDADRYDQRVSLSDGAPTGRNIVVLTRPDTRARIGAEATLTPAQDPAVPPNAVRTVRVGEVRLFFFDGRRGLPNPAQAYLAVEVTYTTAGDPAVRSFPHEDLGLEAADGTPYPRRDLSDTSATNDVVFVVPATFERGTLTLDRARGVTVPVRMDGRLAGPRS